MNNIADQIIGNTTNEITITKTNPAALAKIGSFVNGDLAYVLTSPELRHAAFYLIKRGESNVGWMRIRRDNTLGEIEVLPEVQKQGIATRALELYYGERDFRYSFPTEAGEKLMARFSNASVEDMQ